MKPLLRTASPPFCAQATQLGQWGGPGGGPCCGTGCTEARKHMCGLQGDGLAQDQALQRHRLKVAPSLCPEAWDRSAGLGRPGAPTSVVL